MKVQISEAMKNSCVMTLAKHKSNSRDAHRKIIRCKTTSKPNMMTQRIAGKDLIRIIDTLAIQITSLLFTNRNKSFPWIFHW